MQRSSIVEKVRECIAESLAMDIDDIREDSRLTAHLGADEGDLADIVNNIESTFSIDVLDPYLELVIRGKDQEVPYLSEVEVEKTSYFLPVLLTVPNPSRIPIKTLSGYLTVESLVLIVERRLGR